MAKLSKLYTMQEAAQHNTQNDCWVVIDGKVYDVSTYLNDHPGGDDVLLVATGKDATEEFEDAGHSKSARELMEEFLVGELDPTSPVIPEEEVKRSSNKVVEIGKQYWAVSATVVGVAVVLSVVLWRRR